MNLLIVAPDYPKPGRLLGGVFNERSVLALKALGHEVDVLVPRPYVPPGISSLLPRWKIYSLTPSYEERHGVHIYRPAVPVVPGWGSAFWRGQGAFLWCRTTARKIHRHRRFQAIISFDLAGAGALAWRIGRDLGIPASGWATGSDVRQRVGTRLCAAVSTALRHLDVTFYQSRELLEKAAALLGTSGEQLSDERHIVLPRGIPAPPKSVGVETRIRIRRELGVREDEFLVLSIGRISREKGIFELLKAISLASHRDPRIRCVIVGSTPAFDETKAVQRQLDESPQLNQVVKLLPACDPKDVWEFLSAADIYAFTSHNEGMPNSLLEAMALAIPAVSFAIPAVSEINESSEAVMAVPPFNCEMFAETILRLVSDGELRKTLGAQGRCRVDTRYRVDKNMAIAADRIKQEVRKRDIYSVSEVRTL